MIDTVREVVANVMEVPLDSVGPQSSPDTIEAWDSIKHMNLVLALEQVFGVQFSDEQIIELMNVELIVATIEETRNNA